MFENKKTPIQNGAGTTTDFDFSTDTAQNQAFVQKLENLPNELLTQPRFFKVGTDKIPLTKDWSNPQNQKMYSKIDGLAGFDCSGHGVADDYCLLDFDHIFDDKSNFVTIKAEQVFKETHVIDNTTKRLCYFEYSISRHGAHILIKPTPTKFQKLSAGKQATLYLTDDKTQPKDSPKLEIFYKTGGRYCLFTGHTYFANHPIISGEQADALLKKFLDAIDEQNRNAKKNSDSSQETFNDSNSAQKDFSDFTNNADYDQWRALKMLDCIPCSAMSYDDWRSIGMALKNNGNSLTDWINWSATDARFKVGECEYKWKDFNDKGLTIATIHSYAKDYGYDEKATRREWYELHPEYQTKGNAWQNSDFAQDKDSATDENNRTDEKADSDTPDKGTPKLDDTEKFALFSLPHTDLYNSRRILIFHGKNIRYLTDSGKWYTYNNNVWKDGGKENGAILPFALNVADLIFHNADLREESGTEEKLKKAWQSRKTISNAIELLKGENKIRITEQDLNTHKNLLNCKNCVVDLETGKTYKHNSKLLLTQCVNAEYRKGYHSEIVDKFLRDVLPDTETLNALLRYLGYCLTGEVSAEKALFIHGKGGNGKGSLTKLLFNLLGDYACGFPIESILTQPYNRNDGDSATPAFNKLQWRRLAVAEEIPAGRKLDYAKFKILTGGDALPIRKLHQEATEIKDPVHKFIFSGNHLPELDDAHDAGILRRWIQIKFEQDFTGDKGDETLKLRLQTQDSLSAMLTLLVENSIEWYKNGLIISDKMKADRNNYFAENDFISEFISEFCIRGNGLSVKRKDFLQQLKNEYPNETRGKSDQELTSAVAKIKDISYKKSTGGVYRFFNIGLRDL